MKHTQQVEMQGVFLFFPNVVTKSRLLSDIAVPVDCAAGFFILFYLETR